jgi:beta-lactamase regulating signal transducer with metallopeptidase domain
LFPSTHWIAAMVLERMLYCLAEGSAVAAVVAVVLRLTPERNSRSRFAVWLATLAAVVTLPVVQMGMEVARQTGMSADSSHALVTLSGTLAQYIVLAWATVAGVGLMRVGASLWQIRRVRRDCFPMNPDLLGPELRTLIDEYTRRRRISILVSGHLEVPTAIGFFRPAIVIPAWLADGADHEELKYVLLHELAHLQRWDDWTNLAQKLAKAVFFFHPGVWWIERKLSLDREMACDDAVLAQTGSPRLYARCLARVAEKSFLRRQIMLAQAAVDRMRQLSMRVGRILNADRPRSTRLWRPGIPMVAMIALLCAVSISSAPNLVSVKDRPPSDAHASLPPARTASSMGVDPVFAPVGKASSANSGPSLVQMAKFTQARTESPDFVPRRLQKRQLKHRSLLTARSTQKVAMANKMPTSLADERPLTPSNPDAQVATGQAPVSESPDQRYGMVMVVMTGQRITSAGTITWQVNMWELRVPVQRPAKPIPRKT